MPESHLILSLGDSMTYADTIDEALVGLMLEEDVNVAPVGRREVDAMLSETIWNDSEGGMAQVRLMDDREIPAQWVSARADDERLLRSLATRLADVLPVESYEALRSSAMSTAGGLTRLALTHDSQLREDMPGLVRSALSSAEVKRREDAVTAAQLSGLGELIPLLRDALGSEGNAGVQAMLRHALNRLEPAAKD